MMPLPAISSLAVALLMLVATLVVYRLLVIIYRLYLHPLSRFPGPKRAAATTLYRAYYQVYRDGGHVEQFTKLHARYGPVVRVSPNKLHFRRPKAFEDIFKFNTKFIKDPDFYDHLGQSEALFGMVDENEHKERFKLVSDLFSKRKSQEFEQVILRNTNLLCGLLLKSTNQGLPINIAQGLRAVVLDIAQDFVFDNVPDHLRGLYDERFDTLFVHTTFDVMDWTAWCFRNFPLTLAFSNQLPQWLRRIIFPGEAANIESFETIQQLVKGNVSKGPNWSRDSLLSRMANKVSTPQLTAECMGTMFGAVINLANMLPYGVFYVCETEFLQERVYNELKSIWEKPDDEIPSYSLLVRLPLLNGIVKESLRLMHGIIIGPPRVTPPEGATIDGYYVPPNTVVTTSSYYSHMNPDVFPEPERFNPERWQSSTLEMERSLVPFSKGKRMCPGKEISLMELFIIFAALFRRFNIQVFNTTERDFEWKVYISLHFKGKLLHAHMKPRPEFSGTSSRFSGLQKMVSQF